MRPIPVWLRSVVLFLAVLCSSTTVGAGDWPRFRGPLGDGRAPEADPPLKWGDGEGVLWRTELPGPGSSSPIVVDGRVYLTCYSGYGLSAENPGDLGKLARHAICVDLASGKLLWNREIPNEHRERRFTGPYITQHGYASSTPASDGERVYFFLGASGVAAYTLDGEPVWQADVGEGVHAWGAGASPILFENLLIVNASVESDALVALDKRTGERVWSAPGMPRAWNTPLLVEFDDAPTELVVSVRGKIRGLDPQNGEELWTCRGINAAELCPSPVEHGGVVFVLGHPRGEAMAVRAGGRGDVTESHVLWRLNKGSNVGSPVYHDGHLYWAGDKRGIAYCVDANSGEVVYEQRMTPNPGGIYASPILADGRIYYTARDGATFVVAAEPEYRLLAHNRLGDDAGRFNGSAAAVEDELLLRSDRFLHRIGGK